MLELRRWRSGFRGRLDTGVIDGHPMTGEDFDELEVEGGVAIGGQAAEAHADAEHVRGFQIGELGAKQGFAFGVFFESRGEEPAIVAVAFDEEIRRGGAGLVGVTEAGRIKHHGHVA